VNAVRKVWICRPQCGVWRKCYIHACIIFLWYWSTASAPTSASTMASASTATSTDDRGVYVTVTRCNDRSCSEFNRISFGHTLITVKIVINAVMVYRPRSKLIIVLFNIFNMASNDVSSPRGGERCSNTCCPTQQCSVRLLFHRVCCLLLLLLPF
jgi:hypothetical protein